MIEERNGISYDPETDAIPQDYFKLLPDDPGRVKVLVHGLYDVIADRFAIDWCYDPALDGKAVMMVDFMGYDEFAKRWQDYKYGLVTHVLSGYDLPQPAFFEEDEPYFQQRIAELSADDEVEGAEWFCEDADWWPA